MKRFLKKILLILGVLVVSLVAYFFILMNSLNQVTHGKPIPDYDLSKSALMVIDVQEATTGPASTSDKYSKDSDAYVAGLNELIEIAGKLDLPVIYIYSEMDNWLLNFMDSSVKKGSFGTQLDSRLLVASSQIFTKGKQDAFCNPKLDDFLLNEQINRLYITGLDAAHCVNSTIQAAQNRGYEIVVIEDAVLSETDELKQEKLDDFKRNDIKIIHSFAFAAEFE